MLLPLRVPGCPVVPRGLALLALREPRLVPCFLKWRAATGGLGLVVAQLSVPALPDDGESLEAANLGSTLERIGREQGRALRSQLGYGRSPLECARAVAFANRLFGIRAKAVGAGTGDARVITPGCPWSRESWWGPRPCAAFGRFEAGLTAGLNPSIRLRYESKRTRGDSCCAGVYTWRTEEPG
jgi:hypothetical protein